MVEPLRLTRVRPRASRPSCGPVNPSRACGLPEPQPLQGVHEPAARGHVLARPLRERGGSCSSAAIGRVEDAPQCGVTRELDAFAGAIMLRLPEGTTLPLVPFWQMHSIECPALSQVALLLHSVTVNGASTEGLFSHVGGIHAPQRDAPSPSDVLCPAKIKMVAPSRGSGVAAPRGRASATCGNLGEASRLGHPPPL